MMKKYIIALTVLVAMTIQSFAAKTYTDSINFASISDTVIVISKSWLNFGRPFSMEIEYTDLDADDATFDLGTRLEIPGGATGELADSTFNSFGNILGIDFPVTLDATTNAHALLTKASFLVWHPDRFGGTELLLYIDVNSVSSGYLRYKIIW
jgi:hypothetical protein